VSRLTTLGFGSAGVLRLVWVKRGEAGMKSEIKQAIEATAIRGSLIPDRVVTAASEPTNPLHSLFEWDNRKAAHQHRLDTARELIRSIRYSGTTLKSVSYVHDPRTREQAYVPLSRAAKNKKLSQQIIEAEISRCQGAIHRAREVAAVLNLTEDLDDLLRDLVILRRKVTQDEAENRAMV
jgi:hypothetical protein